MQIMKNHLFFLLQLFLHIYAKLTTIYNCEQLCFELEACVKQCKKHSLKSLEHASETNRHQNENSISVKNKEDEDEEEKDAKLRSVLSLSMNAGGNTESTCGLRKVQNATLRRAFKGLGLGRIVGGEDAAPHEFPWQISMQIFLPKKNQVQHFCGGSILNDHWVLTAAHCLDVLVGKESQIIVKMGSNKMMDESTPKYSIDKVVVHQNWNRKSQSDDIALMRLKGEIKIKTNDKSQYVVNTICLPERDSTPKGFATLSGWGQTSATEAQTEYLQKIDVPIYDQQKCAINYKKYVQITETKLCAGGKGGQDSCMGDSGGPLIQMVNGRATQIGVVSFGYPCAVKDMPGVYTKLSKYLHWINQNIK